MRRNMSLLENIFSVKNSDLNHKQICLLGFKIKWHKEAKPRYAYEDLPIENNKISEKEISTEIRYTLFIQ